MATDFEPTNIPRVDINSIFVQPEPNTGCWLWRGSYTADGYGYIIRKPTKENPRWTRRAHRLAYEIAKGPVPNGFVLDHVCRVRCCVNPEHLEVVTNHENVLRGSHGRMQTHCKRGHVLSGSNLIPSKRGWRLCRECRRGRKKRESR